ncbi:MAG TPA: ribosome biogenesis/translation initiation ATPase RLI [Euryarchaeota archaeon]|nr:ribosome biogenesis/translation initiation ATPase RLI [Euryarchaeota archaeon]
MRIAVLLKDRCQPRTCSRECINFCPRVRLGDETIVMGEDGKPVISEDLCVGCGICVNKCPYDAIRIIGLPAELEGELVHQYGMNGFRLYRLPVPKEGRVVGLLGPNGIGKTTILSILSGQIIPNLGEYGTPPRWEPVLEKYKGTEIHDFLSKISKGETTVSVKPQYVDALPKFHKGKVSELLGKLTQGEHLKDWMDQLDLNAVSDRDMGHLSGGELQRVALAATLLKDSDVLFVDEPSSYLDIHQRLSVARIIRKEAKNRLVVVVEHDLAILDFLCDQVHVMYGSQSAYGVLSQPKAVRSGINAYLVGYLKEENVRIRDKSIIFEPKPPRKEWEGYRVVTFEPLEMDLGTFKLETDQGAIHRGEVVGVVGHNATGKTTFVRALAGELMPTRGTIDAEVKVSYKPQYIKPEYGGTVEELFMEVLGYDFEDGFFQSEIEHPLILKPLMKRDVKRLSGGELQRVSIALSLAREADLYLLDEPSAYLDSSMRMEAAKTIRRVMEKRGKSGLIIDHDVYFIDMVSDSIMVFGGVPSVHGMAEGPFEMRDGMNRFLKQVDITFRRDNETQRPRVNKEDSLLDREQKSSGEHYYAE